MKKVLFTAMAMFLIASGLTAQNVIRNDYSALDYTSSTEIEELDYDKWGVYGKSGIFRWKHDKKFPFDIGFGLEMGAAHFFTKNVYTSLGLGWYFASDSEKIYGGDYEIDMHTLRLPLMVGYRTNNKALTVSAGFYADHAIVGKAKYDGETSKFKDDDDFNKTVFGVSANITLFNFVSFEYNFGLSDRWKDVSEESWYIGLRYIF